MRVPNDAVATVREPASPPPPHGVAGLAALADQCVKCGLCLPHCPTYRVAREEGESPRGRIAFARHVADGGALSPRMRTQLDDCLACGSCEAVCPSHVRYTRLLDELRARTFAEPAVRGRLRGLATRAGWTLRVALRLGRVARALGLAPLLRRVTPRLARLAELAAHVPRATPGPVGFTPASGTGRGAVAVFRGCVASVTDADTQLATVDVLARLGHDVHAPAGALCCGALARHAGDAGRADTLARETVAALAGLGVERVVGTASGCQRELVDRVLVEAGIRGAEIMTLVDADPTFATLALRPVPRRAVWLVPCTESAAAVAATERVLARIPGLHVERLPLQPRCCGAAGLYFADHPAIAEPLRDERVAQVAARDADVLLTTNVGCRLYIGAGLARAGRALPVMHPITLVAEALPP